VSQFCTILVGIGLIKELSSSNNCPDTGVSFGGLVASDFRLDTSEVAPLIIMGGFLKEGLFVLILLRVKEGEKNRFERGQGICFVFIVTFVVIELGAIGSLN